MAWNDSGETIIAGTGEVYVAPVGTTEPANESSTLNTAFFGLGYHDEDGVAVQNAPELQKFGAWQSKKPIRIERGDEAFRLTFKLLQWNEKTVPLAFGGGTISDLGSGHYKFTPPLADDAPDERCVVADVIDGDNILRIVIPRCIVVDDVESELKRDAMGMLPITVEAMEPETGGDPWYFLTNIAGFATGS